MSAADPLLARVMLSELPRVGEQRMGRVLAFAHQRHLDLADVLGSSPSLLACACRLPRAALTRLTADGEHHLRYCQALLARARDMGIDLRTPYDIGYPQSWLRRALPPPPLVYFYGADTALTVPAVAILNSRSITARSVSATVQLVESTSAEGFSLITGGMKSTHRIAAVTARATGARRVIVLDRGLFATFADADPHDAFGFGPSRSPLDTRNTLVVSPFRLNDHAVPRNGRRRDQLMAALADVVVAVSARPGGEIERICLQALDRGQPVLSWQGENRGIVAAGATVIDQEDLRAGLQRFLTKPVRSDS